MSVPSVPDDPPNPDTELRPSDFWLTRLVTAVSPRVRSPFLGSVLLFGLPPLAVVVSYLLVRWRAMQPGFRVSLLPVVVVLIVAPYLVWYYDCRLYPRFVREFADVVSDEARFVHLATRNRRLLAERWWVAAVLASLPIPVLLALGRPFLRDRGLYGVADPLFWGVVAVLLWIGVLVGIGFLLVLVTVLTARALATEEFVIDPLHPDSRGGVGAIGELSIQTTLLFAVGALLLPVQLQYAATVGTLASGLIYLMAFVYAGFIAASFVYPTVLVYRRVDAIRNEVLDELRHQYRTVKHRASEPAIGANLERTDSAVEQKLQRIRREYEDFRTVPLYPLELSTAVRLVGTVLLPLAFVVIDTMLQPQTVTQLVEYVLG